ncbi:hypothetical protein [Phascolarctobacterium sp.]
MTCNCQTILTTAVAVTDNQLVLTIPAGTYENCKNYVIRIAQDIPTTATNIMPVVIQIGTGSTLYAVNRRCGHRLYANQVRTRRNYVLKVAADTETFVLVNGCITNGNCGIVAALPVAAPAENA